MLQRLTLFFLSLLLLVQGCAIWVTPTFAADCTPPGIESGLSTQTSLSNPNCAYGKLGTLISVILTLVILAGAITAFVFMIIGAFQWGTAKGGDGAAKGRTTMLYAIIGLLLLGMVYVVIIVYNNLLPHSPVGSGSGNGTQDSQCGVPGSGC